MQSSPDEWGPNTDPVVRLTIFALVPLISRPVDPSLLSGMLWGVNKVTGDVSVIP